jgi:hypothetical protein
VSAQGVILQNYRYSAFGVELNYDLGNTNPFRFAGEYWDANLEVHHNRFPMLFEQISAI